MPEDPEEYEAVPVIPLEGDPLHTADNPFCYDGTCGCHEDPLLIEGVAHFVDDGLLTPEEATDFVAGHML